jgi:hypothetical protein
LLELSHPLTEVTVRAESPLPEDFRSALGQLRQRTPAPPPPRPSSRRTS